MEETVKVLIRMGKVGADVTVEQGYQAARLTALSMLRIAT